MPSSALGTGRNRHQAQHLRLSIGIEHIDDIKEDLNEALKHL